MSWTFRRPPRSSLALVFCPLWANLAPPSLAYLRGALAPERDVEVFDLNGLYYRDHLPHPEQSYWEEFSAFTPLMGLSPDWQAFAESRKSFDDEHGSWLDTQAARLARHGIVAFSINQSNALVTWLLAERLRRLDPDVLLLAGGPSMAMDDGRIREGFLAEGLIDLAITAMGEEIIDPLVEALLGGNRLDELPGLHRRGDDGFLATTRAGNEFHHFALPDYGWLEGGGHFEARADWLPVYAVRGCVGRCEFCTLDELHGRYRVKPFEWIRRELDGLNERHGTRRFFFADPMFLASKNRARELFEFAVERGYELAIQIRLAPYWDDEALVALAARCLVFCEVGLDGGSEKLRRAMGKMASAERTLAILRLFWKHDLPLYLNLIVGYPDETEEDFQETLALMTEHVEAFRRGGRVIGTGTNTFFLPNGFPLERYAIEIDELGHWFSPQVKICHRVDRIERLRALAETRGVGGSFFYAKDTVEGIPLRRDDVSPEDAASLTVDWQAPSSKRVGSLDRLRCHGGRLVVAEGWALDPGRARPASELLLSDGRGRIVARGPTGLLRRDVSRALGDEKGESSGFRLRFDRSRLGADSPLLRAWAFDGSKAWPLETAARLNGADGEILRPPPPLDGDDPLRPRRRRRRSPCLFTAVAMLLLLLLPLLLFEALLQLRHGFRLHRSGWKTSIPPDWRDPIPEGEKNQLGLRGRPFRYDEGDFVILLVGDSQVEARSLPFAAMPERILETHLAPLARAWKRPVRVFSIGAGAWGQDQELLALRDYFRRWRADLVLNWITWENDLFNVTFAGRYPTGNLKPSFHLVKGRLEGPRFPPGTIIYHSRLLEMVERFFRMDPESRWEAGLPEPYRPLEGWTGPVNRSWEERRARGAFPENLPSEKAHVSISLTPLSPRMSYSLTLLHALLERMADETRRQGGRFLSFSVEHVGPCPSSPSEVLRSVARSKRSTWSEVFVLDGRHYRLSREQSDANRRMALGDLPHLELPMNLKDWAVSEADRHLNEGANDQVLGRLARLLPFHLPTAPPELAPPIEAETRLAHALGAATERRPYRGRLATLPGRIECEDFDEGGEGIAYHDTDEVNHGGVLRKEAVDLHGSSSWACVGWVQPGEWLRYSFRFDEAAPARKLFLRAVALKAGQRVSYAVDDAPLSAAVDLPRCRDWNDYRLVELGPLSPSKGRHVLHLQLEGRAMGLDYVEGR